MYEFKLELNCFAKMLLTTEKVGYISVMMEWWFFYHHQFGVISSLHHMDVASIWLMQKKNMKTNHIWYSGSRNATVILS